MPEAVGDLELSVAVGASGQPVCEYLADVPPADPVAEHVVRVGTGLQLNGSPYRMVGFNIWPTAVNAWNAGDPRIAVWELVNAGNAMTQGFASDVSGLIKSIDSVTPVGCGGVGGGFPGLATIDLVSDHYYTNYGQTGWQSTQQAAAAAGKPWYIGEGGFNPSSSRAQEFQSLPSSVFNASNSAGFVAWQFANQGGDGLTSALATRRCPC